MNSKFKILFVASEASPLAKIGGLGDVVGSLPRALKRAGHDARIVMPKYSVTTLEDYHATWRARFNIPFLNIQEDISIAEVLIKDGIPVYLLQNNRYFERKAIYGEPDDIERFLFFSMAVMELAKRLGWQPDILHCHDWHTGMVPALLKVARGSDPFYSSCASIFTIHNLAYQGCFDHWFATRAGLFDYMLPENDPLRNRTYNMSAIGICNSDVISTVSETYAKEILTPEYGAGLEMLLERRKGSLSGILNGIDYDDFNPASDRAIPSNFDFYNLDRRVKNKLALQEKAGLPINTEIPLLGMAGRVVEQKGLDILDMGAGALESLLAKMDVQFVLQGIGEPRYEESLKNLQRRYPDKMSLFLSLDFSIARLIFAGCDMLLVPSRFEPCGLTPMIAMRYGSIPVVRHTGGMAETVIDCHADLSDGLGFAFNGYDSESLLKALIRGLGAFQNNLKWRKLMIRAMQTNYSWVPAIPKYEALYKMARNIRVASK